MLLDRNPQALQVVLAGAVATAELQWNATYRDLPNGGARTADGVTDGTTDVSMLSSTSTTTQKQVLWLSVYNADTAVAVVTIKMDYNATERIIKVASLAPGATLEWSLEGGFRTGAVVADAEAISVGTLTESVATAGILVDGLRIKDASVYPVVGGSAWANLSDCATGEADTIVGANLANAWSLRTASLDYAILRTTTATPGWDWTFTHTGASSAQTQISRINHATNAHVGLDVSAVQLTTARTGGTVRGISSKTTSLAADSNSVVYSDFYAAAPTDGGGTVVHSAFTVAAGHDRAMDLTACATGEGIIAMGDNLAVAWALREAANAYLTAVTTNDGERLVVGKVLAHTAQTIDMADAQVALVYGTAGAGEVKITSSVLFVDANSGATEDLLLPAEATSSGVVIDVYNTGGESIVVKEDSDTTTIATVATTKSARFACNGTTWFAILGA